MITKKLLADLGKVAILVLLLSVFYIYYLWSFNKDKAAQLQELNAYEAVEGERIVADSLFIARAYLDSEKRDKIQANKDYASVMIELDFVIHDASAPKEVVKIVLDSKEVLSWIGRVQALARNAKTPGDLKEVRDLFEEKIVKRLKVIRKDMAALDSKGAAIFYKKSLYYKSFYSRVID